MNTIDKSAFWPGVARLSAWPQLWRRAAYERAMHRFNDARRIFAQLGNRIGQIVSLLDLILLHIQAGEFQAANRDWEMLNTFDQFPVYYKTRAQQLRRIIDQSLGVRSYEGENSNE